MTELAIGTYIDSEDQDQHLSSQLYVEFPKNEKKKAKKQNRGLLWKITFLYLISYSGDQLWAHKTKS